MNGPLYRNAQFFDLGFWRAAPERQDKVKNGYYSIRYVDMIIRPDAPDLARARASEAPLNCAAHS
jgi:hypothetical protein